MGSETISDIFVSFFSSDVLRALVTVCLSWRVLHFGVFGAAAFIDFGMREPGYDELAAFDAVSFQNGRLARTIEHRIRSWNWARPAQSKNPISHWLVTASIAFGSMINNNYEGYLTDDRSLLNSIPVNCYLVCRAITWTSSLFLGLSFEIMARNGINNAGQFLSDLGFVSDRVRMRWIFSFFLLLPGRWLATAVDASSTVSARRAAAAVGDAVSLGRTDGIDRQCQLGRGQKELLENGRSDRVFLFQRLMFRTTTTESLVKSRPRRQYLELPFKNSTKQKINK